MIVHLSPHLPPAICGVTDYAALVGRTMELLSGDVRCVYLGCGWKSGPSPKCESPWRDVREKLSADALWNAVEELSEIEAGKAEGVCVVLHYSGYGYDRGGAPNWIADAVENRPSELRAVRVVSVFHELYATGRPWQRAFWSSGRQRRVAERVARASDALMTNRAESARWLEKTSGRPSGSVPSVPVASNVGEPTSLRPFDSRLPRAIAFGRPGSKRFALVDEAARVAAWMKGLGLTELVDVGALGEIDREAFAGLGIRIEQLGELRADKVSSLLSASRVGFIDYNPPYVEKSGVMAAYLAHGVVPVMRRGGGPLSDFYTVFGGEPPTVNGLTRVAATLSDAYARRRWHVHAQTLLELARYGGEVTQPVAARTIVRGEHR